MTISHIYQLRFIVTLYCLAAMIFLPNDALARANTASCDAAHTITQSFVTSGEWSLCWAHDAESGVAFSNIVYSSPYGETRRVLGDLSLSQLELQYDDGREVEYLVTEQGLGNSNTLSIGQSNCTSGDIIVQNGNGILCSEVIRRGYIYKYYSSQKIGYALQLRTLSNVNGLTFVQRWQFFDSGDITVALGISGELQEYGSSTYGWKVSDSVYATGFTLLPIWRMDFDIGADPSNDKVVEIESRPSNDRFRKIRVNTEITNEAARPLNTENKRFWQIVDGSETNGANHFVSYQLEPLDYSDHGRSDFSLMQNDFFVTRYNQCEQHAIDNPQNNCGSNLNDFINGQTVSNNDLVIWYKTMYHHVPRSEDNNAIPLRWTGYIISPRDWLSDNSFVD